jgi:hypothetical protein
MAPVSIQPAPDRVVCNTKMFSASYVCARFGPSLAPKDGAAEWAVRIEEDQT